MANASWLGLLFPVFVNVLSPTARRDFPVRPGPELCGAVHSRYRPGSRGAAHCHQRRRRTRVVYICLV